jgi:protein arginine N-methyltransferase 1
MTLPLAEPLDVVAGNVVHVSFRYHAGGPIPSLQASIRTSLLDESGADAKLVGEREAAFA